MKKLQKQKYNGQHQVIEKPDKNYLPYGTCFQTETSYNLSHRSNICDQNDSLGLISIQHERYF